MQKSLYWHIKSFNQLTNLELYNILQLRTEVFVVEQTCIFQDMDGKDRINCQHIFGVLNDKVVACARFFPPGVMYKQSSLGRICTSPGHRGMGIGKALMDKSLEAMEEQFPGQPIRIGAQTYLNKFYQSFGFVNIGAVYMEDGIEHIEMVRSITS